MKFTDHYSNIVFSTILREGGGAGHGAAVHATLRWLDEHLPYPNTIKEEMK